MHKRLTQGGAVLGLAARRGADGASRYLVGETRVMAHWLLKSEPSKYSWDALVRDRRTHWNGVRNHQASNNLKAMRNGDRGFFYHSNEGLSIVGILEIIREYYPDPSDSSGRFGMVDVKPVAPAPRPVA